MARNRHHRHDHQLPFRMRIDKPRACFVRVFAMCALTALVVPSATLRAQLATRYRPFAASAERARERSDWPEYARLIDSVYANLGNHPSTLWARARADAREGRHTRALDRLREYAAAGMSRDLDADSAFIPLRSNAALPAIRERLIANGTQAVRTRIAVTLGDSMFLPEGLVYDPATDRLLTSSIRHGVILGIAAVGTTRTLATSRDLGLWALFGMAIDSARRTLWVASQQIPHYNGFSSADSGRTAVAALDLDSGLPLRRLAAPNDGVSHSFGDVAVLGDGGLVVADAASGALYTAALGDSALRVLVAPGRLVSPQGIASADDDRTLYVADYALGIVRIDRASGEIQKLAHHDSIVVSGVDGLIRIGKVLVGVQNGTNPKRVVRFELDVARRAIVRATVLEANADALGETTHLTSVRGDVYFVARSGFDLFGEDGRQHAGRVLVRPVIRTTGTDVRLTR